MAQAYDFFAFLLNRFLTFRRYLCGTKEISLRSSRILIPSISRPIRASHEPGVNGVNNAATPIRINMMPKIILRALRMVSGKKDSLNIFALILDASCAAIPIP